MLGLGFVLKGHGSKERGQVSRKGRKRRGGATTESLVEQEASILRRLQEELSSSKF